MRTNEQIRERIEAAERAQPFCTECGQPTTVAVREQTIVIQCPVVAEPRSFLSSLRRLDFATFHTSRKIASIPAC